MRAIFALFLVTAVATAQLPESNVIVVEPHVRGANTQANEDRDLQSTSFSQSIPFNVVGAKVADDFCFDYKATCLELAHGDAFSDADANATGNTGATAMADIDLWSEAFCHLCAEAYAKACAFYSYNNSTA
jgi:hypothetical protein